MCCSDVLEPSQETVRFTYLPCVLGFVLVYEIHQEKPAETESVAGRGAWATGHVQLWGASRSPRQQSKDKGQSGGHDRTWGLKV